MPRLQFFINLTLVLVTFLYPFIWYFGQIYFGVTAVTILMACIWLLRALLSKQKLQKIMSFVLVFIFMLLCWIHSAKFMYWYPVMVSILLLLIFGASLFSKQSVIERLARLQHPDLPESGIRYTRCVTQIWCGFFIVNILIISALILGAYWRAWAIYTGVISYMLMGMLLSGEFLYRRLILKISI